MCLSIQPIPGFKSGCISLLVGALVWSAVSSVAQEDGIDPSGQFSDTQSVSGERLIPAAFGIRTDGDGNSWNVEADGNIGRIGSTMVNSGLMLLVNEEKFTGVQPAMSPDGNEFVIQGMPIQSLPGLRIQRRVKLMVKSGGLCYFELFYNGSTDKMDLSVGLATNFSGNYKTFLSDRGRSEPVIPSSSETAIIVMPGTSESPKAFLFTHSNARSAVKPTISAQNRYGLTLRYQLSLDPGESRILIHRVAQVIIPQSFDRRSLLNLSSPYRLDEVVSSLPDDWGDLLANVAPMQEDSQLAALGRGGLASFVPLRGAKDVLVIGGETRLPGEVTEKSVGVSSLYGDFEIDLDGVAAITGGKGASKAESRIFFNDGQILTVTMKPPGLTFTQTDGGKIVIDSGDLDQLIMSDTDSAEDWTSDSLALIETVRGDRIKVRNSGEFTLGFSTLWGNFKIGKENLIWMKPVGSGIPGHWVELRDGTKCYGVIAGEEISLKGTDYGDIQLPASAIKQIFTRQRLKVDSGEGTGQQVKVRIVPGGQLIVGSLAEFQLLVQTGGELIETASSEIRRVARVDSSASSIAALTGDSPAFEIERWDGGVMKGALVLDTIPVQADGITWQIPVRDIEGFEINSPLLTPETASQIIGLVRQLGVKDWAAREAATRELGAFGYLARPVLQSELSANADPEVARRIKRILEDLN